MEITITFKEDGKELTNTISNSYLKGIYNKDLGQEHRLRVIAEVAKEMDDNFTLLTNQ